MSDDVEDSLVGAYPDYEEAELELEEAIRQPAFARKKFVMLVLGTILVAFFVVAAVVTLSVPIFLLTGDDTEEYYYNAPDPYVPEYTQQAIETTEDPLTFEIPPNPSNEIIYHTSEFQIVIGDVENWITRETELAKWLATINEADSYLFLERANANTSARYQYKIDASGSKACSSSNSFRVRDYLSDYWAGNTLIDIKQSASSENQAISLPLWPSDDFSSHQKSERDVYGCDDKYSRESRVYFEYHPLFETCFDLLVLYPWAFSSLTVAARSNPLKIVEETYWWVVSYNGVMDGDTKYEISWAIQYDTKEGAIYGKVTPSYGEWSIRLYTTEDGLSQVYNTAVQSATYSLWDTLQTSYGDHDHFGC